MKLHDKNMFEGMDEEERRLFEKFIGMGDSLKIANGIAIINGLHSIKRIDDDEYESSLLKLANQQGYDIY